MQSTFSIDTQTVDDTPNFTLHPVRGVVWAAFWGSPLAAGVVMAINYSRMGNKTAARNTFLIGVAATVALIGLIFAIPEDINIPDSVFLICQLVVAYSIAKAFQGDHIQDHERQGGTVASGWPSVGIGILCLPVVLIAIFGIAFLLEPSLGTLVEFGNDEVYYSGDATEEDARKLGGALQEIGFFGSHGVSVSLKSASDQHVVSFVLVENAWDDPEMVEAFTDIGRSLIEAGFSSPLTVELCDDYLSPQETVVVEGKSDIDSEYKTEEPGDE